MIVPYSVGWSLQGRKGCLVDDGGNHGSWKKWFIREGSSSVARWQATATARMRLLVKLPTIVPLSSAVGSTAGRVKVNRTHHHGGQLWSDSPLMMVQ